MIKTKLPISLKLAVEFLSYRENPNIHLSSETYFKHIGDYKIFVFSVDGQIKMVFESYNPYRKSEVLREYLFEFSDYYLAEWENLLKYQEMEFLRIVL